MTENALSHSAVLIRIVYAPIHTNLVALSLLTVAPELDFKTSQPKNVKTFLSITYMKPSALL